MFDDVGLEVEYFAALMHADARIAAAVAREGCPLCGGPLHVANFARKPRGGLLASAGEEYTLRFGLCCGRRGCRRRALPPSLRFLGRRVYLEAVVLFASAWAQVATTLNALKAQTGVSVRTLGRWLCWWREEVPQLGWWAELRSRLVPPALDESDLPRSMLESLRRAASTTAELTFLAAKCLAPGTTSMGDVARFVRCAETLPARA
jgi:hypothetical protein